MSNIKTTAVQLGDNATATQNFTLRTNNDGTATLARGNVGSTTQDLITVDVSGNVVLTQKAAQTVQDVTASRAIGGGPYTNNTGQDITVYIRVRGQVGQGFDFIVDGVSLFYEEIEVTNYSRTIAMDVPNGSTYRLTITAGATTLESWKERR